MTMTRLNTQPPAALVKSVRVKATTKELYTIVGAAIAPDVSGYRFVSWVYTHLTSGVGVPHVASPTARQTNVWWEISGAAPNANSDVECVALYVRDS